MTPEEIVNRARAHGAYRAAALGKLRGRVTPTLPTPTRAPQRGPGDAVALVLAKLGYKSTEHGLVCPDGKRMGQCGCEAMRRKMNEWGYVGCWRRRKEIGAFFVQQAARCGVALDSAGVLALMKAALREWRKRDQ